MKAIPDEYAGWADVIKDKNIPCPECDGQMILIALRPGPDCEFTLGCSSWAESADA